VTDTNVFDDFLDKKAFQKRLDVTIKTRFDSIRHFARECARYTEKRKEHPYKISRYLKKENPSLPVVDSLYAMCRAANVPFDFFIFGKANKRYTNKKNEMLDKHIVKLEAYIVRLEAELTEARKQA